MAISNQQRLCGQLVVDFANARSTDEAGLKYFENVQKVFGFPPQFADMAKANFPTINAFHASLTDCENQCFERLLKMKELLEEISFVLAGKSVLYDIYTNVFSILEHVPVSTKGSLIRYETINEGALPMEKLKKIVRAQSKPDDSAFESRKIEILASIPKLVKIGAEIKSIKEVSRERLTAISEYADLYRDLCLEHGHIKIAQENLRSLLHELIQQPLLSHNVMLRRVLLRYNQTPKSEIYLSCDGTLQEHSPFNEDLFLHRECVPLDAEQIYNGPLSYCVVQFLRDLGNRKYLKKCRYCNVYIVTVHVSRQFCDEPAECKTKFYNRYRAHRMKAEYRNPDSEKFKVDYLR